VGPSGPAERGLLGLDAADLVIEVERIRFADQRRGIYSRDRIPAGLLARVADRELDRSLYALLARGRPPSCKRERETTSGCADDPIGAASRAQAGHAAPPY
jgi:DNA-binding GntR family transcriptional regulator